MLSVTLNLTGNVSCTKNVGQYDISTALSRYSLTDMNGKQIKMKDYSDLVDLTDDDAKVVAAPLENDGRVIKFTFFDTPGLDDSDGNDMEIMADIIGKVGELDHLNAVIYVRNMNRPFGNAFTRFFDYIQRSMPNLCNGLIIVNSGFTVEKVEEFLSRKKDLAKIRKEAFKVATGSNLDLAHFFMDNNPDEFSPFAVMQSLNECFRLLSLLSSQKPLPASGLKLLKTPNMWNIDVHILYALERLHNQLKDAWNDEVAVLNKSKATALRTSREIQRLATKIATHESQLEELNTGSDINLGTRNVSVEYSIFKTLLLKGELWLDERPVTFDSDTPIAYVEKSATGGSRWLDEDLRGTSWRSTLTAGMFRSINGSVTCYTTSRLKHKREIELLKSNISDTTQTKVFHEDILNEVGGETGAGLEAKSVKLGEDVEKCAGLIETVNKETFDVALWPLLRRFYVGHQAPSRDHVHDFVQVYNPEIANLL